MKPSGLFVFNQVMHPLNPFFFILEVRRLRGTVSNTLNEYRQMTSVTLSFSTNGVIHHWTRLNLWGMICPKGSHIDCHQSSFCFLCAITYLPERSAPWSFQAQLWYSLACNSSSFPFSFFQNREHIFQSLESPPECHTGIMDKGLAPIPSEASDAPNQVPQIWVYWCSQDGLNLNLSLSLPVSQYPLDIVNWVVWLGFLLLKTEAKKFLNASPFSMSVVAVSSISLLKVDSTNSFILFCYSKWLKKLFLLYFTSLSKFNSTSALNFLVLSLALRPHPYHLSRKHIPVSSAFNFFCVLVWLRVLDLAILTSSCLPCLTFFSTSNPTSLISSSAMFFSIGSAVPLLWFDFQSLLLGSFP